MSTTYFKDDLIKLSKYILIGTLLFYLPILLFGAIPELFDQTPLLERGGYWRIISFVIGFIVFLSFFGGLVFLRPNGARRFVTQKFHIVSFISKLIFFIIIEGMYGFTIEMQPIMLFILFGVSLIFDSIALFTAKNMKEEKLKKKIVKRNGLLSDGRLRQYKLTTRYSLHLGLVILLLSFRHQIEDQTTIFFMGLIFIYSIYIYNKIFQNLKVPIWRQSLMYTWTTVFMVALTLLRYFSDISILETTSLLIVLNTLIYMPVFLPLIWMSFRVMWHYDYALAKGLITRPI